MKNISRLFKSTILISVGSLLLCSHLVQADLNIGGKTIFTGTLIEVLAPGPDLPAIIANITDASATNPYLVKLGPGVYDLGTTTLEMMPYVEISGSGQDTTIIKGNVSAESWSSAALIEGADNATLSHLTVDNVGNTYSLSAAIFNDNNKSPTLKHVTLKVYPTGNRMPVHNNNGASPMIMDSSLIAGGGQNAIYNYNNSHPTVIRSYLKGGIGVWTKGSSSVTIEHSYIYAPTATVRNDGYNGSSTTNVFASTLNGGPADVINDGITPKAPKCAGVTDENNTFYASTCP